MLKNLSFLFLLFPIQIFACSSDYECGYGKHCIKPSQSYSLTGTCVTITNQYGVKDYNADKNWGKGGFGPKKISGCQWNTDCPIGSKCLKESGQIYGICLK